MNNNSLIEYKESFVLKFLKKLKYFFIKKEENQNINNTNDKEESFDLYKKVVNKEIDLQTLDNDELERIHEILEEEVKTKKSILAKKLKLLEEKAEILKKIINE